MPPPPLLPSSPLRLAHRGDWRRAPENTLPALLAAVSVPGCDGVEFDVQLARDGTPVVLHDETLARVQGRFVHVEDLDLAELAGHGIPSLAEVMGALPEVWMDVELKGPRHGEATAAVLRAARGDQPGNAVVSSFEVSSLQAMADALPGWPRWLGIDHDARGGLATAIAMGCTGVSVEWRLVTPALVRRAHAAGLEVAAWTVRRRTTYRRLARLGVRAVCVEASALDGDGVRDAGGPQAGDARTGAWPTEGAA
jgi:glycerophosphoryl diester phosphodiesterase